MPKKGTFSKGDAPELHKLAAIMAGQAYEQTKAGQKVINKAGWHLDNALSTAEASVYVPKASFPDSPVIVAFRGTVPNSRADIATDVALAAGKIEQTPRYARSMREVRKAAAKYPDRRFMFTGHSLGGTLALWMGREFDAPAVAFNPGVGQNLLPRSRKGAHIYRTPGDLVSFLGRMYTWLPWWATPRPDKAAFSAFKDMVRGRRKSPKVKTLSDPVLDPLSAHGIDRFGGNLGLARHMGRPIGALLLRNGVRPEQVGGGFFSDIAKGFLGALTGGAPLAGGAAMGGAPLGGRSGHRDGVAVGQCCGERMCELISGRPSFSETSSDRDSIAHEICEGVSDGLRGEVTDEEVQQGGELLGGGIFSSILGAIGL